MPELFKHTSDCPGDYGVVCMIFFHNQERQRRMTCLYSLHAISFIRGHYGKVASKAPSDRVTVHQRKLRSIFHIGQRRKVCPSSKSEQPQGCSIQQASACLKPRASCPAIAFGYCLAVLIFTNRRIVLPTSKEVFHHTQSTPVLGHVGSREAIPQPRKARVASDQAYSGRQGVVAHDRFVKANSSVQADE